MLDFPPVLDLVSSHLLSCDPLECQEGFVPDVCPGMIDPSLDQSFHAELPFETLNCILHLFLFSQIRLTIVLQGGVSVVFEPTGQGLLGRGSQQPVALPLSAAPSQAFFCDGS